MAWFNPDGLQRLPHFNIRFVSCGAPQADHLNHRIHFPDKRFVYQVFICLGKCGEMNTLFGAPHLINGQVLIELLGDKRNYRGKQFYQSKQRFIQGLICTELIRITLTFPETSAGTTHIPIAHIINKASTLANKGGYIVGGIGLICSLYQLVKFRYEPLIQFGPFFHWQGGGIGVELIDVCIGDEKGIGVPERQNLPPDIISNIVPKIQILHRIMPRINQTHHIHAHIVSRFVKGNGIAGALVHLLTFFITHQCMTQECFIWRFVFQHSTHRQQRVKPVPELPGQALRDKICREPLFPVLVIGQIMQGGIRDNSGIQPGIAHIRNSGDRLAAGFTFHLHFIDMRTMRRMPVKLIPSDHRLALQLLFAANNGKMIAIRAFPYRKR